MYTNSKTYITRGIKDCPVWEKIAFRSEDLVSMKIQKQLNHKLRSTRGEEREKIETLCSVMKT